MIIAIADAEENRPDDLVFVEGDYMPSINQLALWDRETGQIKRPDTPDNNRAESFGDWLTGHGFRVLPKAHHPPYRVIEDFKGNPADKYAFPGSEAVRLLVLP